jgi:hypothetical protein
MVLALSTMSQTAQAIFFLIALVLFAVAALARVPERFNLVAAGLAFVAFVYAWNALAAS